MKYGTHSQLTVDDWKLLQSPESFLLQKELVELGRVVPEVLSKALVEAGRDNFGFEQVGEMTGLWIGMVWGIATLPVVALDGPLPIMDAAWLAGWGAFTLRAISVGGTVGAWIDDQLE